MKQENIRAYGIVEIYLHAFLTSALDEDKWSASYSGRFILGEEPSVSIG
jgi:hypothetical protein